jgi:hypothetical protein
MIDELPFKVVRSHDHDHHEVLARAVNLLIARRAYQAAARMYPEDLIELRQRARDRTEQMNRKAAPWPCLKTFGVA